MTTTHTCERTVTLYLRSILVNKVKMQSIIFYYYFCVVPKTIQIQGHFCFRPPTNLRRACNIPPPPPPGISIIKRPPPTPLEITSFRPPPPPISLNFRCLRGGWIFSGIHIKYICVRFVLHKTKPGTDNFNLFDKKAMIKFL